MNAAQNAAADAVHALNNALQALRIDIEMITDLEVGAASDLIGTALERIGELHELLKHQEATIEEQRVESVKANERARREHEYATRVEEKNSELNLLLNDRNIRIAEASRAMEDLLIRAATDLQATSTFFNDVRRAREKLDPTIIHETPRLVAAGGIHA